MKREVADLGVGQCREWRCQILPLGRECKQKNCYATNPLGFNAAALGKHKNLPASWAQGWLYPKPDCVMARRAARPVQVIDPIVRPGPIVSRLGRKPRPIVKGCLAFANPA